MSDSSLVRNLFTVPMKNLILLIIGLKGETHGYEILKEIERITFGNWKPSHGNLYTMLNKLADEGLVESREEYRGKRRVIRYRLTEKGWLYLREANELTLKSLYLAIQYHERLREKLREMGYGRELAKEAVGEYLKLLDGIIEILQKKREQLRDMIENSPN
ncbi:PadR family transcriptional regulator [Thermococcus gammatolerans]|uniref:Transcription regulator, PadR-like family n=1 Tax=Thermococcus gammatolerans (strain DSM 15229 / JCM 11827 / EJ3) TaxID=593117 RepID=C5A2S9_THEGJ|nr:PadR family transcriptional regulator [Thermococcus gammatolerans]ACS32581.1 Transcription regulator, PadR-like family [Thermococcus gammatolerans EJ3]